MCTLSYEKKLCILCSDC